MVNIVHLTLCAFSSQFLKVERTKRSSEQHVCKSQILKLEVMTEPPTVGGMTVRAGQKYTVRSAKTKIQELSGAVREATTSVDLLSLISDHSDTWSYSEILPEHTHGKTKSEMKPD